MLKGRQPTSLNLIFIPIQFCDVHEKKIEKANDAFYK